MSQPQDVASPVAQHHTDTEPEKQEQQQDTHEMSEKQDGPEAHDEKETTTTTKAKQEDLGMHKKDEDSIAEKHEDKAEDKHEDKHKEKLEESNDKPEGNQQQQLSQNDTKVERLSSGTESDDTMSVGLYHIPPSTYCGASHTTDAIPYFASMLINFF
jgi:hypothetical protein